MPGGWLSATHPAALSHADPASRGGRPPTSPGVHAGGVIGRPPAPLPHADPASGRGRPLVLTMTWRTACPRYILYLATTRGRHLLLWYLRWGEASILPLLPSHASMGGCIVRPSTSPSVCRRGGCVLWLSDGGSELLPADCIPVISTDSVRPDKLQPAYLFTYYIFIPSRAIHHPDPHFCGLCGQVFMSCSQSAIQINVRLCSCYM